MGKRNSGFTLVELIIVITLIVVLSIISISYLRSQIFKGNDARRKADINRIKVAVEEYEKDKNCYPDPSLVVCNPGNGLVPYLSKIPCDPIKNTSYNYENSGGSCPSWYRIYTNLDNSNDSNGFFVTGSPNAPEMVSGSNPTPSPPPNGDGGGSGSGYWGYKNGVCVELSGRLECSPNYQSQSWCEGVNPPTECI